MIHRFIDAAVLVVAGIACALFLAFIAAMIARFCL